MNRNLAILVSTLSVTISLLCSPWPSTNYQLETKASEIPRAGNQSQVLFEDQTEQIVGHAERLIEKNEREGAVLDQRWYTLKRFEKYQDLIFGASKVLFYGGLEKDVRKHLQHQYTSVVPVENAQDPGEIRFFYGTREGQYDLIIIGQNGREVALKTIIRLVYLGRFLDDERKRKFKNKLLSFNKSLRVFMSSVSAKQEFIAFFNQYAISNPDAVMIGFRRDIRTILRDEGIEDPKSYADESLRVNWYADANGLKVLLVSIDGNRIFGSRSGELIQAILKLSDNNPPSVTFLGSGGAIDEPGLVGKMVRPAMVVNADPFPAAERKRLVHLVRNNAINERGIRTLHASVENVIVETFEWAARMKQDKVRTVDQELFHIMNAINSSANAPKVKVFIGILVTDNVSSNANADLDLTLEHAEEAILKTADIRKEFLSKVLTSIGVVKHDTISLPERKKVVR